MLTTALIFIITLLILVVSHEFGHFIMAKRFGVKVLEFGFGLPPRIWGKKIGETIVSLNLLPIGGFVRLFGEDETDKKVLKKERSFASKPVSQRMVIVIFGVLMNFLLAVVLFWIVLGFQRFKEQIPLLIPYNFVGVNQTDETFVLIGNIAKGSPAEAVGIQSGDRVVAVDNRQIEDADDLIQVTREKAGTPISLTLADTENDRRIVEITPRADPPRGQGPLGIELGVIRVAVLNYQTTGQRLTAGFTHSYNLGAYSITILGNLISESLRTKNFQPVSQSLSGPVGVTKIADTIIQTRSPVLPYLNFMALLSLNLAIINILPFPALDGGRLFFLLIEAVSRRRVKAEVEKFIHTVGMVLLLGLILFLTFSDIRKFFLP